MTRWRKSRGTHTAPCPSAQRSRRASSRLAAHPHVTPTRARHPLTLIERRAAHVWRPGWASHTAWSAATPMRRQPLTLRELRDPEPAPASASMDVSVRRRTQWRPSLRRLGQALAAATTAPSPTATHPQRSTVWRPEQPAKSASSPPSVSRSSQPTLISTRCRHARPSMCMETSEIARHPHTLRTSRRGQPEEMTESPSSVSAVHAARSSSLRPWQCRPIATAPASPARV
mmetsp:Transcript_4410/g.14258  ORF Transcript_4410/g.14258 Transcript_4410/m.14258 type:complete len:230 (+) Transcript_4410:196-885(+)